jgi:hypothetical protein
MTKDLAPLEHAAQTGTDYRKRSSPIAAETDDESPLLTTACYLSPAGAAQMVSSVFRSKIAEQYGVHIHGELLSWFGGKTRRGRVEHLGSATGDGDGG